MSRQVNLYEAKTNLSALVDEAAQGDEIIIAKNGKAMAKLVPLPRKPKIKFGLWKGKDVWIADDFDGPLPDDIQKYFEGEGD